MDARRTARPSVTRDDIRQFRAAVADAVGATDREALPRPDPSWRGSWPAAAALGIAGLCVPEDRGGSGLQVSVAVGASMELGGALHGSPYAGIVAAARALAHDEDARDDVAGDLLASVVAGERICTFGRVDPATGVAHAVDGAGVADAVVAETPSGDLVLLADPEGWEPAGPARSFDVSRTCADLRLDLGRARTLGSDPVASQVFGLLVAADALGGARRAFDRTVDHAQGRVAFGRPIGGFQAVQHRLADHAVRLRGMELLLVEAAEAIGASDPSARRRALVAEVSISSGVSHLVHDLVQLTGGIGFTWEYGLHLYGRRAHQDAALGANPRRATQLLAIEEGWTGGR